MTNLGFTLVQLRYFAKVAELGSMTSAARELVISQSAISTAVAQLEKELGVQLLLRRRARGLSLTAAGEQFLREVRAYLAHTEDLAEVARTAGQALVGRLTVGCFVTLAPFELPRLLSSCERDHPEMQVSVIEAGQDSLKESLLSGRCELALMYGYDLDDSIEPVRVRTVPAYALVSQDHPLAGCGTIRLAQLADEPMVLMDLPHSGDYLERLVMSTGFTPKVRYRTTGFETVRALVANGLGWSVLNQRPVSSMTYDGKAVVTLEIRDKLEPLDIVLASLKGVRLTRRAQAFVESARRSSP